MIKKGYGIKRANNTIAYIKLSFRGTKSNIDAMQDKDGEYKRYDTIYDLLDEVLGDA